MGQGRGWRGGPRGSSRAARTRGLLLPVTVPPRMGCALGTLCSLSPEATAPTRLQALGAQVGWTSRDQLPATSSPPPAGGVFLVGCPQAGGP